jgi:hypothetical protein
MNVLTDTKPIYTSLLSGANPVVDTIEPPVSESFSIFKYIIKIISYILVMYLVIYIVLIGLNYHTKLPFWLKDLFSPFDFVHKKNENEVEQDLATNIPSDEPISKPVSPKPVSPEEKLLPKPDISSSSTQSSKITNKSGYCYIGEDRGFRSCIKVKPSDECMSGNIFLTEAICINPNLRF